MSELHEKGYVIIEDVLSDKDIEYCKEEFRKWRSSLYEGVENIPSHGIYKHHNVGHTRYAWYIRTRPAVQDVFKKVWSCDDLIVSFDGSCYISKDMKRKDTCWTHTDQAPTSHGLQCYQGFVSLTSNEERTFVVYEGTHKLHKEYFERKGNTSKVNWQRIDKEDVIDMEDRKRILKVPAGAMVLWDSRVFHQNQYGEPGEERMIQYVCFLPKSHPKNTASMQKKRLKYFMNRRTTSHWPAPIYVNGLQPQVYGDESKKIDYEKLKEKQDACGVTDLTEFVDDIMKII